MHIFLKKCLISKRFLDAGTLREANHADKFVKLSIICQCKSKYVWVKYPSRVIQGVVWIFYFLHLRTTGNAIIPGGSPYEAGSTLVRRTALVRLISLMSWKACTSFAYTRGFLITESGRGGPPRRTCYRQFRTNPPALARYKVDVVTLGRRNSKDAVYDAGVEEYTRRMSHSVLMTERLIKPENALKHLTSARDSGGSVLLLDEDGHLPKGSVAFTDLLFNALREGGSKCSFVIGDADGLPYDIRTMPGPRVSLISLSPLTFTHKMVRRLDTIFYLHKDESVN